MKDGTTLLGAYGPSEGRYCGTLVHTESRGLPCDHRPHLSSGLSAQYLVDLDLWLFQLLVIPTFSLQRSRRVDVDDLGLGGFLGG